MSKSNKTMHLFVASALCGALMLPIAALAKPDHTANHIAKMDAKAAKMAGKEIHRDTTTRTDSDKVVDALTLPEKKVFHGMTSAEKSVARHMSHLGKQIFR